MPGVRDSSSGRDNLSLCAGSCSSPQPLAAPSINIPPPTACCVRERVVQWCPRHLLSFGYSQLLLGLFYCGDIILISRLVSFISLYYLTWPCSSEVQQLLSASSCPHSCSARRVLCFCPSESTAPLFESLCRVIPFLSYLTLSPLHEGFLSSKLLLFHLCRFAIFHSHCFHIFLSLEHLSFGISLLVSHLVFTWDPALGFKKPLEKTPVRTR